MTHGTSPSPHSGPDTAPHTPVRRTWCVVGGTVFVVRESERTTGATQAKGTLEALRIAVGVTVAVIWVGYVLALLALGSCDAFGGRCDGTSPPVLEDDVARGAFRSVRVEALAGAKCAPWVGGLGQSMGRFAGRSTESPAIDGGPGEVHLDGGDPNTLAAQEGP